jgi:sugar phosphate isomerase/epimerase
MISKECCAKFRKLDKPKDFDLVEELLKKEFEYITLTHESFLSNTPTTCEFIERIRTGGSKNITYLTDCGHLFTKTNE